ncbi:hypothetical protein ACO2RV_24285 [Ancylobacter sp. VNQ12]|uniref:hypothetical protein n=1 Tax=Ancylobacter sp. VNQ12 TaxID=3400920 RepID=UPI003C025BAA
MEDTGLFNHFKLAGEYQNADAAYDHFKNAAYWILLHEKWKPAKKLTSIVAVAMQSVSVYQVVRPAKIVFVDSKVVGIHYEAVRKNPAELVALTFGLAIAELQAEHEAHPTGLILSPPRINLRAITPADIRHCIRIIAENRNKYVSHEATDYTGTFVKLIRLQQKLRAIRFKRKRR